MRTHHTSTRMLLAAFLGFTCLAAAAQTPASADRPAIYVSEFEVTDPEGMKPYSANVESTFTPFGGHYLVRGGPVVSQEGEPSRRIVMIQFPSMAQAQAWYGSPAYRALIPIRHQSATSRVYTVEGVSR